MEEKLIYLLFGLQRPNVQKKSLHFLPLPERTAFLVPSIRRLPNELLLDMPIEPVPVQLRAQHLAGPDDLAQARTFAAEARERPHHAPLGARVEETQDVADRQAAVPRDPHLHLRGVVLERRRARVIRVEQVGVEVDVAAARRLDGVPRAFRYVEVVCDRGKQGAAR